MSARAKSQEFSQVSARAKSQEFSQVSARRYAAVDLGASSGRIVVGTVSDSTVELAQAHRFTNDPVRLPDGLHWDIVHLYREIRHGLQNTAPVYSIGIDSWAVDYGLLDEEGALLGLPYHYRDGRTQHLTPWPDLDGLYAGTGIAHLPFNTIHQVRAEPARRLAAAAHLLMIPDLLGYWLTGEIGAERTNASTTQLYDISTGTWSADLAAAVGLPAGLLAAIREPGTFIGPTNAGPQLVAVASHDTASAVAAIPAEEANFAYISCGTWSLVGLELSHPILTPAAGAASFTNETGVDGTIRFLRNVMGLWLLQECQRHWADTDVAGLLAAAAQSEPFAALVDPHHPVFLPPGDEPGGMPARIAAHAVGRTPQTRAEIVRCILESLAFGHREAIREASALAGQKVDVVHLVGGGARNALLCQLTADACRLPVVAGPVEATALGNILIQARADGVVADLAHLRRIVRSSQPLIRYEPANSTDAWDDAAYRIKR
jgi:rhamnulokinase